MPDFIATMDLGKSTDYTALAILGLAKPKPTSPFDYAVRHIERWELHTAYGSICDDLCRLLIREPLYGRTALAFDVTGVGNAVRELFEPERTDTDREVLATINEGKMLAMLNGSTEERAELLARVRGEAVQPAAALPIVRRIVAFEALTETYPVLLTGGADETIDYAGNTYHAPKRNVVSVLTVTMQERRLHIGAGLPHSALVCKELAAFEARPTAAGNETFAAREGEHDDLVLAIGIGVWVGERMESWDPSR